MTTATTPPPAHPAQPGRPFGDHVVDYAQAGWTCVLPVPPAAKTPPPIGFTGAEGRDTDPLQLVRWATEHPDYPTFSIALRMPWFPEDTWDGALPEGWCVIGIDVDQYEKAGKQKHGERTLQAHLDTWGPLPPTWTSTARGPGPSRIHLFRAPARRYATRLSAELDGVATGDIEIIQRHHRYAVVWPSEHHDAADLYRWYDPAGTVQDRPPGPHELAWLPVEWVQGLSAGATEAAAASAGPQAGHAMLDQLLEDWRPECADITSARLTAVDAVRRSDAGSRHDVMTERTHHLVQLAAAGHPGVAHAVLELRDAWSETTAGEDRAEEFERALLTTAGKAVTAVGAVQVPRDPCLLFDSFTLPALAPGDPRATQDLPVDDEGRPVELSIAEPPRWAGLRELVGAHAFDPAAGLDQTLAEAVLERTYPALRYAYDSGGWLLRVPDRWELRRRLSPWAVSEVAKLMPAGDPSAEKDSDQYKRAARRARFMTSSGGKAIAGKMDDLVSAGMHPAAVALAELDSDPEVLWAGGMPYSLRDSHDGPAFAGTQHGVDLATPHLHTAGVMPEVRPTPLWDAFLAAVWPDPEIRRWAVRVLSVAVTGYADRALPILLGETGRGKTQVIHLLMSVLDTYGHAANPKLLSPATKEHDTIVFDLKGRRLSFIDEAPSDAKAGQERLKQLTGGGSLTGRQMNQDPVTFRPTHTLVLTANDEPHLVDPAVRARVRLIPCEGDPEAVRVARAAIGHVRSAAWRAEAPGVLASMMSEAAGWLGDHTSASTAAAPEQIRYLAEHLGAEQDPVGVWLEEETEAFEPGTPSRELYQAFTASCLRNNMRRDQIPSETKWGRQVTRLGYPAEHSRHGKRRQLRVSSGGFLPGMDAPRTPGFSVVEPVTQPVTEIDTIGASGAPSAHAPQTRDGFQQNGDGLVTGSPANPSHAKPQVNHRVSVGGDGCDGLEDYLRTHTRATHPREDRVPNASEPVTLSVDEHLALETPAPTAKPAKPKREQTDAAREKAAAKRAAARAEKLAAAAGGSVQLPALVLRHGEPVSVTAADADALLTTITSRPAGELTVDVEHTGYPVGHRHYALRTVQLGDENCAVVFEAGDPQQQDVVRRRVAAAPVLHAHSATADLVPLSHAGLLEHGLDEAWSRMQDTVIPAKIADPALTGSDPSLKKISAAVLREHAVSPAAEEARGLLFKAGGWLTETKILTPLERSGWAQVDPTCSTMVRYAASDVLDDAAIARRLPRLDPVQLHRETTAQRMTARIADVGLPLDGEHISRLLDVHRPALAEAAARLQGFGVENPGSDPQVGQVAASLGALLPPTKTGKLSVAKGALERYKDLDGPLGEFVRARIDYQEHENALGLFLEPYWQLVENGDGRVRPTIYTLAADTGRMSSVRPNVQQIRRQGGYRAMITADPGYALISVDFAQVELRVAAALSGDRRLLAMLMDPRPDHDPHWEIARLVWGPNATKANRYDAKRKVFGRIYGQGVAGMAATDGAGEMVARAVIDAMDQLTPVLSEWSRMVRESVKAGHAKFATYAGRVVHLDPDFPHKAPNYCIQGTARELLIDALMRWSQTRWGHCVMFPVHDELVVMVPEDEAEEATRVLVECMTTEIFGVPVVGDPSAPSFAWQDAA